LGSDIRGSLPEDDNKDPRKKDAEEQRTMQIHLTKKELEAAVITGLNVVTSVKHAQVNFHVHDHGPESDHDLRYDITAEILTDEDAP